MTELLLPGAGLPAPSSTEGIRPARHHTAKPGPHTFGSMLRKAVGALQQSGTTGDSTSASPHLPGILLPAKLSAETGMPTVTAGTDNLPVPGALALRTGSDIPASDTIRVVADPAVAARAEFAGVEKAGIPAGAGSGETLSASAEKPVAGSPLRQMQDVLHTLTGLVISFFQQKQSGSEAGVPDAGITEETVADITPVLAMPIEPNTVIPGPDSVLPPVGTIQTTESVTVTEKPVFPAVSGEAGISDLNVKSETEPVDGMVRRILLPSDTPVQNDTEDESDRNAAEKTGIAPVPAATVGAKQEANSKEKTVQLMQIARQDDKPASGEHTDPLVVFIPSIGVVTIQPVPAEDGTLHLDIAVPRTAPRTPAALHNLIRDITNAVQQLPGLAQPDNSTTGEAVNTDIQPADVLPDVQPTGILSDVQPAGVPPAATIENVQTTTTQTADNTKVSSLPGVVPPIAEVSGESRSVEIEDITASSDAGSDTGSTVEPVREAGSGVPAREAKQGTPKSEPQIRPVAASPANMSKPVPETVAFVAPGPDAPDNVPVFRNVSQTLPGTDVPHPIDVVEAGSDEITSGNAGSGTEKNIVQEGTVEGGSVPERVRTTGDSTLLQKKHTSDVRLPAVGTLHFTFTAASEQAVSVIEPAIVPQVSDNTVAPDNTDADTGDIAVPVGKTADSPDDMPELQIEPGRKPVMTPGADAGAPVPAEPDDVAGKPAGAVAAARKAIADVAPAGGGAAPEQPAVLPGAENIPAVHEVLHRSSTYTTPVKETVSVKETVDGDLPTEVRVEQPAVQQIGQIPTAQDDVPSSSETVRSGRAPQQISVPPMEGIQPELPSELLVPESRSVPEKTDVPLMEGIQPEIPSKPVITEGENIPFRAGVDETQSFLPYIKTEEFPQTEDEVLPPDEPQLPTVPESVGAATVDDGESVAEKPAGRPTAAAVEIPKPDVVERKPEAAGVQEHTPVESQPPVPDHVDNISHSVPVGAARYEDTGVPASVVQEPVEPVHGGEPQSGTDKTLHKEPSAPVAATPVTAENRTEDLPALPVDGKARKAATDTGTESLAGFSGNTAGIPVDGKKLYTDDTADFQPYRLQTNSDIVGLGAFLREAQRHGATVTKLSIVMPEPMAVTTHSPKVNNSQTAQETQKNVAVATPAVPPITVAGSVTEPVTGTDRLPFVQNERPVELPAGFSGESGYSVSPETKIGTSIEESIQSLRHDSGVPADVPGEATPAARVTESFIRPVVADAAGNARQVTVAPPLSGTDTSVPHLHEVRQEPENREAKVQASTVQPSVSESRDVKNVRLPAAGESVPAATDSGQPAEPEYTAVAVQAAYSAATRTGAPVRTTAGRLSAARNAVEAVRDHAVHTPFSSIGTETGGTSAPGKATLSENGGQDNRQAPFRQDDQRTAPFSVPRAEQPVAVADNKETDVAADRHAVQEPVHENTQAENVVRTEPFRPMAPVVPKVTVPVVRTYRQVVPQEMPMVVQTAVRTFPAGTGGVVQMLLTPESLGEVLVAISVRDAMTEVRINTESHESKKIVEAQLPALKEKLVQSGLQVDHIEVRTKQDDAVQSDASRAGRQGQGGQQQEEQKSRQDFVRSFRHLAGEERREQAEPDLRRTDVYTRRGGNFERYA